jgi:hypothetical protein
LIRELSGRINDHRAYLCKCSCGRETKVQANNLKAVLAAQAANQPVISVDTKKKELALQCFLLAHLFDL